MPGVGVAVSPCFGRPAAAAWSPPDLGDGLLNWYDETSWTTSGSDITSWNDLSPGGYDLAPTGGVTLGATSGPAGGPAIVFDGTSGYLRATYTTGIRRERVYLLCRPQGAATINETMADGGAANSRRIYVSNPNDVVRMLAGGNFIGSDIAPKVAVDTTAWALYDCDFNGASSRLRVGSTVDKTGNAGTPNSGGLILGALGNQAGFVDLRVKACVITNGAEGDEVREYFSARYGVEI